MTEMKMNENETLLVISRAEEYWVGMVMNLFMGGHVIPPFLLMVEKKYNQTSTYK